MKALHLLVLGGITFCSAVFAAENDSRSELPPPVNEKVYTFKQIEAEKFDLKDKIVRLEIASLLGTGSEPQADGTKRYMAKDTSNSATPYGQVAFPAEGLRKTGLADNPKKGPLTLYVRIHLFEDKKAAAIAIAVGTHFSRTDGKATYGW
ncbi:MAG TPA: hypothetical protein VGW39_12865 [Chthoniobacterales bacterium]|nr:hypothetical protein [Chthoniobacterales bacterium]